MHDIRYNDVDDEIVVPNPFANAILTFRGGADAQEAPIRIIQGPKTELSSPARLDIDIVNREIIVPTRGSVVVYPLDGNGDVPPKRVIRGPDVQVGQAVAVDPVNNLLVVAGRGSLQIFDRLASGNARPLRVIGGPSTRIVVGDQINQMDIFAPGRLLVVALPGNVSEVEPENILVGMWSLDDDGDVPPKWVLAGEETGLKRPFALALNPTHKEIYVTDMRLNGVFTFSVPEVFEPVTRSAALIARRPASR